MPWIPCWYEFVYKFILIYIHNVFIYFVCLLKLLSSMLSLLSQILGNHTEFQRVAALLQDNVNFDIDVNASVFETNIRGEHATQLSAQTYLDLFMFTAHLSWITCMQHLSIDFVLDVFGKCNRTVSKEAKCQGKKEILMLRSHYVSCMCQRTYTI